MYYQITANDVEIVKKTDRVCKDSWLENNRKKYRHIVIARYNENDLNNGIEHYINGRLIYEYKEK